MRTEPSPTSSAYAETSRRHHGHLGAIACSFLCGCAALLPQAGSDESATFANYEAARVALEQAEPYRTSTAELKALGYDVHGAKNVQLVPYPQWMTRLVHPSEPLAGAEIGIRDCLAAQAACRAYVFTFERLEHDREGNFVVDFLNFQRNVRTHGWRLEAVVLVRDDVVLFRNHGGQAHIEKMDQRTNPLGPLQGLGESALRW